MLLLLLLLLLLLRVARRRIGRVWIAAVRLGRRVAHFLAQQRQQTCLLKLAMWVQRLGSELQGDPSG
jgi:hypothetical protein